MQLLDLHHDCLLSTPPPPVPLLDLNPFQLGCRGAKNMHSIQLPGHIVATSAEEGGADRPLNIGHRVFVC